MTTLRLGLALLLGLSFLSLASVARAGEPTSFRPSATGFEVLQGARILAAVPLPGGPVYDLLRLGNILYVARGESGVSSFDVTVPERPVPLQTFHPGRNAVKLIGSDTSLVVIVADYSAVAYDVRDPQKPVATRLERALAQLAVPTLAQVAPSSQPTSAPGARPPSGPAYAPAVAPPARQRRPAIVTRMRDGWLYIKSPVRLERGDRFLIRSRRMVMKPDPATGQPRELPSNRSLGLFVVDQVNGRIGAGRLARGTQAEVGDLAEPSDRTPEKNPMFPAQWSGMSRLTVAVRPFLPVKELGFGMLTDLAVSHYFRFPLKVGLELSPFGFVGLSEGTGVTGEFRGWLAFTHDYFEIGLAPGVQFQRYDEANRFLFAYEVRIGSLNGLNFEFQNSYVVVKENGKNQFLFQSAMGEINIPVHARFTLTLESGGGRTFVYGAGGLKSYLRGGGGPGTIILRTSVGGAYVKDEKPYDSQNPSAQRSVSGGGPAVSFGIDARF